MSDLERRIEAVSIESMRAVERIEDSVSILAKAIDLNALFDEQGQVMDVVEGDTREFEEVMSSIARSELDSTTRQEGMAIVSTTQESQAAYLSTADAQTVTTLTSQAQSAGGGNV